MLKELDVVELLVDLPADGVRAGSRGTIIVVFEKPTEAYEVEFSDLGGATTAQVVLMPGQLRKVEGWK